MEQRELRPGDVVQIDPAHDEVFGGCLMLVTEPKAWGAQGSVRVPGRGEAYYRVPWSAMEYVGPATWVHAPYGEDDGPLPHHPTTPARPEGGEP